jgi:hypothetical protein
LIVNIGILQTEKVTGEEKKKTRGTGFFFRPIPAAWGFFSSANKVAGEGVKKILLQLI